MIHPWWAEPIAGEIMWCDLSEEVSPRAKPRPVLIITVYDDNTPNFEVRMSYGTSKRTTTLYGGEFAI